MNTVELFRKTYPTFFYKEYSFALQHGDLHITFDFRIPPYIAFHPRIIIKNVAKENLQAIGEKALQNFVFHLGLIEMISYWKTTCSLQIVIEAGHLSTRQITWWKDLILKGMGEFFFQNKINFTMLNFLSIQLSPYQSDSRINEIVCSKKKLWERTLLDSLDRLSLSKSILVPVGGGKDAVVTLELLKEKGIELRPFLLNPKKEQRAILKVVGLNNPVIIERTIDPELLELNKKGFLNGHTPFSAYLAFAATFAAALFGYKYIAVSNERSSNEGNATYLGKTINHQYSKSFDFEKKFREYSKKYLAEGIEYFSFLRPLYELQIAKIFAQYPKYFSVFMSCNEANKTASGAKKPTQKWCGHCSKCLFVYTALSLFISEKTLIKIFGRNLLKDSSLTPLIEELTGKTKFKPFECVGTVKESIAMFSLQKNPSSKLLDNILRSWSNKHFIPKQFLSLLKSKVNKKIIV